MADWTSAYRIWRARRKRFAEEWSFHCEMAARELHCFGLSHREARREARRRLGPRASYRRRALREIGGDLRGLILLLPIARIRRSPWLPPWILALITASTLVLDPLRMQTFENMRGFLPFVDHVNASRLLPLTPPGIIPTGMARLMVGFSLLLGAARLTSFFVKTHQWRATAYGAAILSGLGIVLGVCWTMFVGLLLFVRWGADLFQGAALIAFLFGYLALNYGVMCWWWHDLKSRCPRCLNLLGMAQGRGKPQDILLDPLEVESVCLRGHGQARENRWRRDFECDTSGYF